MLCTQASLGIFIPLTQPQISRIIGKYYHTWCLCFKKLFMWMGVLFACICVYLVPTEEGIWDPLELESQTVVSLSVGAGNQIQVPWKSSECP